MELTLGSLFDGIAGFPLSASRYGIVTKWASEIEAFPMKVTQKHFPNMKHLGDVTKINGAEIEPVDIISFGSPCQDMSVAGKRAGLGGARSGLFMEAVRIIKEMREATNGVYPRFAIWENVPGAFSSNSGGDFRAVLEEITEAEIPIPKSGKWAEAGMVRGNGREVAWRVLDAQHWGVPQRRKRIFLVTDFTGQCAGEILFEREGLLGDITESGEAWEEVAASAGDGVKATSITFRDVAGTLRANAGMPKHEADWEQLVCQPSRINCLPDGITGTVSSKWAKGTGGPAGDEHYNLVCLNDTGGQFMDVSHNVAPTLRAEVHNHPPCVVTQPFMPSSFGQYVEGVGTLRVEGGDSGGGSETLAVCAVDVRNLNETEELSGTLQSKNTGGYSLNYQNPVRIGYRVRRLTPTECLRLQGFPDDWLDIEGSSDSAKYKAVGNSVAEPCPDFIFERIVKVLNKSSCS